MPISVLLVNDVQFFLEVPICFLLANDVCRPSNERKVGVVGLWVFVTSSVCVCDSSNGSNLASFAHHC